MKVTILKSTTDQSFIKPVAWSPSRGETLKAALLTVTLGGALLFATGFAHPDLLHAAAHDWRHSMGFPCH